MEVTFFNMESGLQKRLRNYLETTGLTVAALERKAGLKTNVARNILRGQSKRPTGETLQAIAKVMECSVNDLLEGRAASTRREVGVSPHESPLLEHPEILSEGLECILKIAKDNNYKLRVHQIGRMLEEVYSYTLTTHPPHIDKNFVEWFVKRSVS